MTDRQPGAGPLVRAAALNNAEWCAAMCRSHRQAPDGGGTFAAGLWSGDGRPPPLYPDVVTLAPRVTAAGVAARLGTGPGPASASVKDSFAVLDLTGDGFVRLFDAQWIVRMPGTSPTAARPPGVRWDVVGTAEGLAGWADAWDGGEGLAGLFRPELLREPDVAVLAGRSLSDGRVVAGAVANRSGGDSDSGAEVVGLSNVFSAVGDPYTAWAGALAAAERVWPLPLPVVGYEHPGDDLDAALAVGFHPIGPLTVWLRRTPGSAGGTP